MTESNKSPLNTIVICFCICFLALLSYLYKTDYTVEDTFENEVINDEVCTNPSYAIIEIVAGIDDTRKYADEQTLTFANETIEQLEYADADESIKAIILYIESNGGTVASSIEIAKAVKRVKKPIFAVIKNIGFSGAYVIASATDRIYASEYSEVGNIGVIQVFTDYSEMDKNDGIKHELITSGKFKGSGQGYSPLTEEEKIIYQAQVNILNEQLVSFISDNLKVNKEELSKIADGRTFLGNLALEYGLVHKIGDMHDAIIDLSSKLNLDPDYFYDCNLTTIWDNAYAE